MVQVLCKIWGFGLFSILALTTSNIFLSMHLLYTKSLNSGSGNEEDCSHYESRFLSGDGLKETNQSYYLEFLRKTSIVVGKSSFKTNAIEEVGSSGVENDNLSPNEEINSGTSFPENERKPMFDIDPRLGRFDNRRLFKIFDKVFTGLNYVNFIDESLVCLATQSSVDRLYWIAQVSRNWERAPISLAIFTPDIEYSIARAYMKYLVVCFPHLGTKLSVHFTFPRQFPPKDIYIRLDNLIKLCDQPVAVLKQLLSLRPKEMLKWRESMQYPQNLLRNVARKNCGTEWVFLTDVDVIPIPGLANDVSTFLQSTQATNCHRCAFVIPTYEIHEQESLPESRRFLLKLVAEGRARPFHQKVFVYNQHATNFSRWEAREKDFPSETKVTISHNVTRFEFFYEPFYIARDDVPPHDERFLGYGFTRNTQVYEMFVSGYNFSVLSPIFTLHWGMQVKSSRPAWRERQNSLNRKLFEGFKRELYGKYQRDPLGMMNPKAKIKAIKN